MSKAVQVQTIQPVAGGPLYGQQNRASDLTAAQAYAHAHIQGVTRDFLVSGQFEAAGFDFAFLTANGLQLRVLPGRVYDALGKQFEADNSTDLTIAPAGQLARVDLLYAKLEENVAAVEITLPFARLRTQQELENGVAPYPPTQFTQPTERHNRVTVGLREGAPSATPAPPATQSNEIPLYLVSVAANVDALRVVDVSDQRPKLLTMRGLNDNLAGVKKDLGALEQDVANIPDPLNIPVDLTPLIGRVVTLQEALAIFATQSDRLSYPEVLRAGLARSAPEAGRVAAVGNTDGGNPCVDVTLDADIYFGNTLVKFDPRRFVSATPNARLAQIAGGAQSAKVTTALTLGNVEVLNTDGTGDFALRNAVAPTARSRPACAGRDETHIEVFGGLATNAVSGLSDWWTYDVANDTATPRALTGDALPACDRPVMFSGGNQSHVLLGCANSPAGNAPGTTRWFKVNAATGVVDEHAGTLPTGHYFTGDNLAPGLIFIVAVTKTIGGQTVAYWIYDVGAETFTEIGVSGSQPVCAPDHFAGCLLTGGRFLLLEFTPNASSSGKTYLFDYPTLTWTQLAIPAPAGEGDKAAPLSRFRLANVGGRPTLVGGQLKDESSDSSRVWEFESGAAPDWLSVTDKPAQWTFYDAKIPAVQDCGMASTVPLAANLPRGRGFVVAGERGYKSGAIAYSNQLYASQQKGLVETLYKGQTALTLAESSSFATFTLAPYLAAWDVAALLARFEGDYREGTIKLEYSLDDGLHYHEVPPEKVFTVPDSTNPGRRRIRVTLFSYKSFRPVVSQLEEIFDADGLIGSRFVLRFNSDTGGVKALYINRQGDITYESVIAPSTPDKAILLKTTPNGGSAPTVKRYLNKRQPRIKFQAVAGASVSLDNYLAVPGVCPTARAARAADSLLYRVAEPAVTFDANITVAGVTNGDTYIVEIEG